MKKQLLFSAMVLIGLTSFAAPTIHFQSQVENFKNTTNYRFVEPIIFIEQGIEFLIFPDGSFDFYTNLKNRSNSYNKAYSKDKPNSHRGSVDNNQGKPGTMNGRYYKKPIVSGVIIEYGFNGLVARIGNMEVDYDKKGRIKRLGSIKISYDDGKLSKVGNLKVKYNRWDEIMSVRGSVNKDNNNYKYGSQYSTLRSSPNYKDYENHKDYYYYKRGSTVKKQKKVGR